MEKAGKGDEGKGGLTLPNKNSGYDPGYSGHWL